VGPVEQEINEELQHAVARIPWLLDYTTGEGTLDGDEISTDELLHGVQSLVIELVRVAKRLACEIDQLKAR
jgi:hypothetical protein